MKANFPTIPVVLMTAHGSEEIAVRALRIGAASYVPKQNLNRDLSSTIRDVWGIANVKRDEEKARSYLKEENLSFELGVKSGGHEPLVGYLQTRLQNWGILDETDLIRVGTALHEAFVNAIEHGNLELKSSLRDSPDGAYQKLGEERRSIAPYCHRRVYVTARLTREEAVISIRDEGPGFNPKMLPDPTIPENIGKISGRGLLLIRTFMDDVRFNDAGTEIMLMKRRSAVSEKPAAD
jgi:anti-sigma regulatory factor (Ser/Thr protein kinase)